jgi:hypothetical protein
MNSVNKKSGLLLLFLIAMSFTAFASIVPKWKIGDWWVVESQIFARSLISGGKPFWWEKQSWNFRVDTLDTIRNERYYVISIRNTNDSQFSPIFRFWLRTSDLFAARFETENPHYKYPSPKDPSHIARREFNPEEPQSHNTDYNPIAPLAIPLLDTSVNPIVAGDFKKNLPISAEERKLFSPHYVPCVQEIKSVGNDEVTKIADTQLKNQLANLSKPACKLIMMKEKYAENNRTEKQYWCEGMPWAIYGEITQNNMKTYKTYSDKGDFLGYRTGIDTTSIIMTKRYWLVKTGKRSK